MVKDFEIVWRVGFQALCSDSVLGCYVRSQVDYQIASV